MPIRWDEVDDFTRDAAEDAAASGTLVAPVFLGYDDRGPAAALTLHVPAGGPVPDGDELVRTCGQVLAPLRPSRFAALWPMALDLPGAHPEVLSDDGYAHAVRVVRGEVVADGPPRWTTAVHGHRRAGGRVTTWAPGPSQPLDRIRCPLAHGLRAVLDTRDQGWLTTPLLVVPGPPYDVLLRPGLYDGWQQVADDAVVRHAGRVFPRATLS